MDAEGVVSLVVENWKRLRNELGTQWIEFTSSYREVIKRLPARPAREDLERTVDELCDLLSRHEFGRGLLRGYVGRASDQERMLRSGDEVLDDQERIQQVCNRLTELITKDPERDREPDERDRDLSHDDSRR